MTGTVRKYGCCLLLAAAVAFMPRISARADVQGSASWERNKNQADLSLNLSGGNEDISALQIEVTLSVSDLSGIKDVNFDYDARWDSLRVATDYYNPATGKLTLVLAGDGKQNLNGKFSGESEVPLGTLTVESSENVEAVIDGAKTVADGELETIVFIHKTAVTLTASLDAPKEPADSDEPDTPSGDPGTSGSGSGSSGSSGTSGSGSGGSGGSGSSSRVNQSGMLRVGADLSGLPDYVVSGGTWSCDTLGRWFYTFGRTYANEWAAIYNPYADPAKGQLLFDWFYFGPDGAMVTGWFTDAAGGTYYLNPSADGTRGRMMTGWNWIDGDFDGKLECYYFETQSNGYRGRMYRSAMTPDGYTVNAAGQWTQNGAVVKR